MRTSAENMPVRPHTAGITLSPVMLMSEQTMHQRLTSLSSFFDVDMTTCAIATLGARVFPAVRYVSMPSGTH